MDTELSEIKKLYEENEKLQSIRQTEDFENKKKINS